MGLRRERLKIISAFNKSMIIEERYIRRTEANISNPRNLKVISDESYAVCEFIEILIDKMEHVRRGLNK